MNRTTSLSSNIIRTNLAKNLSLNKISPRPLSTQQKLSEVELDQPPSTPSTPSTPTFTPPPFITTPTSIQTKLNITPKELLLLNKLKINENPLINFEENKKLIYKNYTLSELFRSLIVFQLCQIKPLVNVSEKLINFSYKVLGKSITNFLLKKTFYGHFCAGENQEQVKLTVQRLGKFGVGSIFDYAAESDLNEESSDANGISNLFEEEKIYNEHKKIFLDSIKICHSTRNDDSNINNFVAIKITALVNPELLKKISSQLSLVESIYDTDEFKKNLNNSNLKYENNYVEFINNNLLRDINKYLTQFSLISKENSLSDDEMKIYEELYNRVDEISALAKSLQVKLMIDAEHTYFQPAIDHVSNFYAKKYNQKSSSVPIIFNTYQMYLKSSSSRLFRDLEYAKKNSFSFCVKLVRGAYMVIERKYAEENNLPDPIHNTIEDTHSNYNEAICHLIHEIYRENKSIEVVLASHNQFSIENSIETISFYDELYEEINKSNNNQNQNNKTLVEKLSNLPVYYGQLLGMSDDLTFTLGMNGYKSFKYVPYGKVEEVMPYLIRRAQENSDGLSGAKKELKSIKKELKERFFR